MDLGLPFIISAIGLILVAVAVAILVDEEPVSGASSDDLRDAIARPWLTLTQGWAVVRAEPRIIRYALAFLPLVLMIAGPASQWPLFFQGDKKEIVTGYLWIFVSLMGMAGGALAARFQIASTWRGRALAVTTLVNGGMVILVAVSRSVPLAVGFFLGHVLVMATEEVLRAAFLNDIVPSEQRATVLSMFYTVESLATASVFG